MELKIKAFNQLNIEELYEILAARAKTFVVEQKSAYLDPDGLDMQSLHIFYWDDGAIAGEKVLAYLRLYEYDKENKKLGLGRMLTRKRGQGLGLKLLKEAIKTAKNYKEARSIYLEGQCHAIAFYEKADFVVKSEVFLIDDIPHVKMELDL